MITVSDKTYHKIETPFARAVDGSKKLLDGVYRNEVFSVLKDIDWEFTEKIDGTNIRVIWDGHKVGFAGRTNNAQIPPHLLKYLEYTFCFDAVEEMFEQLFGDKEVIFFGEGYGVKIQKGGLYRPDVSFILFDVCVNGVYLDRKAVEELAVAFNIECVPIILTGTMADAIDYVKTKPISTIGTAPMEGLVGRPKVGLYDKHGNRVIVKIKACDF